MESFNGDPTCLAEGGVLVNLKVNLALQQESPTEPTTPAPSGEEAIHTREQPKSRRGSGAMVGSSGPIQVQVRPSPPATPTSRRGSGEGNHRRRSRPTQITADGPGTPKVIMVKSSAPSSPQENDDSSEAEDQLGPRLFGSAAPVKCALDLNAPFGTNASGLGGEGGFPLRQPNSGRRPSGFYGEGCGMQPSLDQLEAPPPSLVCTTKEKDDQKRVSIVPEMNFKFSEKTFLLCQESFGEDTVRSVNNAHFDLIIDSDGTANLGSKLVTQESLRPEGGIEAESINDLEDQLNISQRDGFAENNKPPLDLKNQTKGKAKDESKAPSNSLPAALDVGISPRIILVDSQQTSVKSIEFEQFDDLLDNDGIAVVHQPLLLSPLSTSSKPEGLEKQVAPIIPSPDKAGGHTRVGSQSPTKLNPIIHSPRRSPPQSFSGSGFNSETELSPNKQRREKKSLNRTFPPTEVNTGRLSMGSVESAQFREIIDQKGIANLHHEQVKGPREVPKFTEKSSPQSRKASVHTPLPSTEPHSSTRKKSFREKSPKPLRKGSVRDMRILPPPANAVLPNPNTIRRCSSLPVMQLDSEEQNPAPHSLDSARRVSKVIKLAPMSLETVSKMTAKNSVSNHHIEDILKDRPRRKSQMPLPKISPPLSLEKSPSKRQLFSAFPVDKNRSAGTSGSSEEIQDMKAKDS